MSDAKETPGERGHGGEDKTSVLDRLEEKMIALETSIIQLEAMKSSVLAVGDPQATKEHAKSLSLAKANYAAIARSIDEFNKERIFDEKNGTLSAGQPLEQQITARTYTTASHEGDDGGKEVELPLSQIMDKYDSRNDPETLDILKACGSRDFFGSYRFVCDGDPGLGLFVMNRSLRRVIRDKETGKAFVYFNPYTGREEDLLDLHMYMPLTFSSCIVVKSLKNFRNVKHRKTRQDPPRSSSSGTSENQYPLAEALCGRAAFEAATSVYLEVHAIEALRNFDCSPVVLESDLRAVQDGVFDKLPPVAIKVCAPGANLEAVPGLMKREFMPAEAKAQAYYQKRSGQLADRVVFHADNGASQTLRQVNETVERLSSAQQSAAASALRSLDGGGPEPDPKPSSSSGTAESSAAAAAAEAAETTTRQIVDQTTGTTTTTVYDADGQALSRSVMDAAGNVETFMEDATGAGMTIADPHEARASGERVWAEGYRQIVAEYEAQQRQKLEDLDPALREGYMQELLEQTTTRLPEPLYLDGPTPLEPASTDGSSDRNQGGGAGDDTSDRGALVGVGLVAGEAKYQTDLARRREHAGTLSTYSRMAASYTWANVNVSSEHNQYTMANVEFRCLSAELQAGYKRLRGGTLNPDALEYAPCLYGFLGCNESLLPLMQEDWSWVATRGQTHLSLASYLDAILASFSCLGDLAGIGGAASPGEGCVHEEDASFQETLYTLSVYAMPASCVETLHASQRRLNGLLEGMEEAALENKKRALLEEAMRSAGQSSAATAADDDNNNNTVGGSSGGGVVEKSSVGAVIVREAVEGDVQWERPGALKRYERASEMDPFDLLNVLATVPRRRSLSAVSASIFPGVHVFLKVRNHRLDRSIFLRPWSTHMIAEYGFYGGKHFAPSPDADRTRALYTELAEYLDLPPGKDGEARKNPFRLDPRELISFIFSEAY